MGVLHAQQYPAEGGLTFWLPVPLLSQPPLHFTLPGPEEQDGGSLGGGCPLREVDRGMFDQTGDR